MKTAKLIGTENHGALGDVPVILCEGRKPKFKNNGYDCYSGQEPLHVPGLREALIAYDLREGGDGKAQGHVYIKYTAGGHFGTFTSDMNRNDTYSFC